MNTFFLQSIIFLYGLGGVITVVGYLPTIFDLWKQKSTVNTTTYFLWTVTGLSALLYGLFILDDFLVSFFAALNTTSCILIVVLQWRNAFFLRQQ